MPPGAAQASRMRSPGRGASNSTASWAAASCTETRPSANPGSERTSAGRLDLSASGANGWRWTAEARGLELVPRSPRRWRACGSRAATSAGARCSPSSDRLRGLRASSRRSARRASADAPCGSRVAIDGVQHAPRARAGIGAAPRSRSRRRGRARARRRSTVSDDGGVLRDLSRRSWSRPTSSSARSSRRELSSGRVESRREDRDQPEVPAQRAVAERRLSPRADPSSVSAARTSSSERPRSHDLRRPGGRGGTDVRGRGCAAITPNRAPASGFAFRNSAAATALRPASWSRLSCEPPVAGRHDEPARPRLDHASPAPPLPSAPRRQATSAAASGTASQMRSCRPSQRVSATGHGIECAHLPRDRGQVATSRSRPLPCGSSPRRSLPAAGCGDRRRGGRGPARRPRRRRPRAPSCASRSCSSPAVSRGADRRSRAQQHRPGVEPCIHPHDGHAGARVAREDRRAGSARRRASAAAATRGCSGSRAAARRARPAAGSGRRPRRPGGRRAYDASRAAPRRLAALRAARRAGRARARAASPAGARRRGRGPPGGRAACRRPRCAWPASCKASSAGTANSGVPAKTMRSRDVMGQHGRGRSRQIAGRDGPERSRRSARLLATLLFQLLADARALQLREVVDEQLALEVIHLVLDADREQPVGLELERLAVAVECAHARCVSARAVNVSKMPGTDRQPSSASTVPSRSRISGLMKASGCGSVLRHVDDQHSLVDVDLRRGQADARRRIHGLEHVVDQPAHGRRRPGRPAPLGTQSRVRDIRGW